MPHRVLLSWSSGKDCAWALHLLRQNPEIEVVGLLTTFNETIDRVAMHDVRRSLVEAQASAAGLELWPVFLPWPCSNEIYEGRMSAAMKKAKDSKIDAVAFGDLFLEDVRDYRIKQMARTGIDTLFPLWGLDTTTLSRQMLAAGLRAITTCIDPKQIPESFVGREFDAHLLSDLPDSADPCGENGEFHTFCYAGPMFSKTLHVQKGEAVIRDGFHFVDLTPKFL